MSRQGEKKSRVGLGEALFDPITPPLTTSSRESGAAERRLDPRWTGTRPPGDAAGGCGAQAGARPSVPPRGEGTLDSLPLCPASPPPAPSLARAPRKAPRAPSAPGSRAERRLRLPGVSDLERRGCRRRGRAPAFPCSRDRGRERGREKERRSSFSNPQGAVMLRAWVGRLGRESGPYLRRLGRGLGREGERAGGGGGEEGRERESPPLSPAGPVAAGRPTASLSDRAAASACSPSPRPRDPAPCEPPPFSSVCSLFTQQPFMSSACCCCCCSPFPSPPRGRRRPSATAAPLLARRQQWRRRRRGPEHAVRMLGQAVGRAKRNRQAVFAARDGLGAVVASKRFGKRGPAGARGAVVAAVDVRSCCCCCCCCSSCV